jgi:hypothetical protein
MGRGRTPTSGAGGGGLPLAAWAAALAVIALVLFAVPVQAAHAAGEPDDLQYVSRHTKAHLLRAGGLPPELIVFGGSRVFKAQPSYIESVKGPATFNSAVADCRPADVWAFEHYVRDTLRGGQPRYIWFLALEAFRVVNEVPPALREIPELGQYLWPAVAPSGQDPAEDGGHDATALAAAARWRFDADGWLSESPWDAARRAGRTLEDLLPRTLERYRRWYKTQFPSLSATSLSYLRDTVVDMNNAGEAPLIVLPPYLPRVRREIEQYGFRERRAELRAYFAQLQEYADFTLVDLSRWRGPDGWRRGFYDGVHMDARLCRMVLRELFASAWWDTGASASTTPGGTG